MDDDAELRDVADILDRNRIKRVPVLQGGRLVGIAAPGVEANAAVSEARAIVCSFMPSNDGAMETYVGIARITIVSGKPPRQLHVDVDGKGASGNSNHAGPPATELRF